jgi:hypothetical protein
MGKINLPAWALDQAICALYQVKPDVFGHSCITNGLNSPPSSRRGISGVGGFGSFLVAQAAGCTGTKVAAFRAWFVPGVTVCRDSRAG